MTNTQYRYTAEKLAELTQSLLEGDGSVQISGIASLEKAEPGQASFLGNIRYEGLLETTKASLIVVNETTKRISGKNYLVTKYPDKVFQKLIDIFCPKMKFTGFAGIHATAVVHPSARLGAHVTVGPHATIDEGAEILDGTYIGAGSSIGPYVVIGQNCIIHQHVVIREGSKIGNRVVLQPGAVIGSCGYGFSTDQMGRHTKLDQVGIVIIEDDVEIGANTTIDRARFDATVIGQGTKIDNLVQIAHNVQVGKHNLIVAQVGIAGSSSTGNHVVLAGKVAVNGHIKIGDQVIVAACSGVSKSLEKGKYAGVPVMPLAEYNKNSVLLRNIDKYVEEIKSLRKEIDDLKSRSS